MDIYTKISIIFTIISLYCFAMANLKRQESFWQILVFLMVILSIVNIASAT